MSVQLTPDQDAAITDFLNWLHDEHEREMVLEGYPGCGKSFVTKYMLEALKNQNKVINMLGVDGADIEPLMTATTNKAAKVLGDFVGMQAKTIHSLLGLRVQNDFKTGETKLVPNGNNRIEKQDSALIIIDEASYVDNYLLKMIRDNTYDCKILYIGDRYQLANVKCSKPPVFYEIANKATLTTSKRFGEKSTIARLGQQMRDTIDSKQWQPIIDDGKDVMFVDDYTFKDMLEEEFDSLQHDCADARILAWTNRQVQKYNSFIRGQFTNDVAFADGEQVMLANSMQRKIYDEMTGKDYHQFLPVESILTIEGTPEPVDLKFGDPDVEQWIMPCYKVGIKGFGTFHSPKYYEDYHELIKLLAKQAKNHTGNWIYYFKAKENLLDIRPNFATTVYKAQGSTYKRVFIDLNDIGRCNQSEQVARMLHVAITRASDQVIFRGSLPSRYEG